MEKIKIGITQGNTNGTGYEVILKAFEDPTSLELCLPIIYGNKDIAVQHRKAMNLATNFVTIKSVQEAQEGRLSLLQCVENAKDVALGENTPEAELQGQESLQKALADHKAGILDALVINPCINPIPPLEGMTEMLINEDVLMALVPKIDAETVEAFCQTLVRDFDRQHPRIAILSDMKMPEGQTAETFEGKHMLVYGPYAIKDFFEQEKYMYFDGVITVEKQKATEAFASLAYEYGIRYFAGSQFIITAPFNDAGMKIAGKGTADVINLNHATFIATDVYRNRKAYDAERQNPLPKLFHDKREDKNTNNVE